MGILVPASQFIVSSLNHLLNHSGINNVNVTLFIHCIHNLLCVRRRRNTCKAVPLKRWQRSASCFRVSVFLLLLCLHVVCVCVCDPPPSSPSCPPSFTLLNYLAFVHVLIISVFAFLGYAGHCPMAVKA